VIQKEALLLPQHHQIIVDPPVRHQNINKRDCKGKLILRTIDKESRVDVLSILAALKLAALLEKQSIGQMLVCADCPARA
jgi:hypothetical protein